jgi:hypothetical protein
MNDILYIPLVYTTAKGSLFDIKSRFLRFAALKNRSIRDVDVGIFMAGDDGKKCTNLAAVASSVNCVRRNTKDYNRYIIRIRKDSPLSG